MPVPQAAVLAAVKTLFDLVIEHADTTAEAEGWENDFLDKLAIAADVLEFRKRLRSAEDATRFDAEVAEARKRADLLKAVMAEFLGIDPADEAARYLRLSISVGDVEKQAAVNVLCDEITRLRATRW